MINLAILLVACTCYSQEPAPPPKRTDFPLLGVPPRPRDVVSLRDGTIVLVDSKSSAHRSADGGKTWEDFEIGAPVESLCLDEQWALWGLLRPAFSDAPPIAALVRSRDEGRSWQRIALDPSCLPQCFIMDFRELALLSTDGQLWHFVRREDGEGDWQRLGVPTPDGQGLACTRMGRDTFVVSSRDRIHATTDQGRTWHVLREGGCVEFLSSLGMTCGTGSHREYAVTRSGQLISFDSELQSEGERMAWALDDSRIERQIAGLRDVPLGPGGFDLTRTLSGVDATGRPIVVRVGREKDELLPPLPCEAPVRARDRLIAPCVLGDALYVLSPEGDRWERLWPR